MQECKFCNGKIQDEDKFCRACGYDPKTDKISPDFAPLPEGKKPLTRPTKRNSLGIPRSGVSPGVKKFALISMIIVIFSIFYKNHFSIVNVVAEIKHSFTMLSKGKMKFWEDDRNKKIEYIDVRDFEESKSRW